MRKILAIDDKKDNLTIIKAIIKTYMPNCVVLTSLSGKEGIEIAIRDQPDTILLDIIMPQMDGFETCIKLKSNSLTKQIPVVLITAIKTDTKSRIKGLEIGADAFLSKPIDPLEFTAQLKVMLRIKEVEDKLRAEKLLLDKKVLERTKELSNSEARSRSITQTATDAIVSINDIGIFTSWNLAATKIFGYNYDEVINKEFTKVIPKKYREAHNLGIAGLKNGAAEKLMGKTIEITALRKDGTEFPIALSLSAWKVDGHKNFTAIIRDITTAKQANKKIKKQNEYLNSVIESLTHPFYVVDIETYEIKMANTASGYKTKDKNVTCHGLTHHSDFPCTDVNHPCPLEIIKQTYKPTTVEHIHFDKNNKTSYFEVHGYPIFNDKGRVVQMIEYSLDITERRVNGENLRKLSTAVQQSPTIIVITDLNGVIEYVNPKFVELTGYAEAEAIGRVTSILKSGELTDRFYKEMWDTITSGGKWMGEFHNKKKNGELYWEFASISPIVNDQGTTINYLKVAEDITERKHNEQIKSVLYNISNSVITSDNLEELIGIVHKQLGTVINTTNFYVALYDERFDTFTLPFLADEYDDVKSFPAGNTLTSYVVKTRNSLLATSAELEKLSKLGKFELLGTRSKVWAGVPLLVNNYAIGVIAVQSYTNENAFSMSDVKLLEFISEHISILIDKKKKEYDLIAALHKATESDRLKSAFLATISHELRTPLNAIIGFSDLITEDWPIEEIYDFGKNISSSGKHLLGIIDDLFDITLIESGETKLRQKQVEILPALREIHNIMKSEQQILKKSNLDLNLIVSSDLESVVCLTDVSKLKQILINLLKNALKFTNEGYINYGFVVDAIGGKDVLKFYVEDTGIGITKEKQKHIFNVFRQVDDSYSRIYGGVGIGLSIAEKLTKLLGGNIWLKSKENKGSTFYFTLPYEKTDVAEQLLTTTNLDAILKSEQEFLSNKTVLIAEDDDSSFELLDVLITQIGAKVIWAKNGETAIQQCKYNLSIDLVLMDINMPVLNGYAAIKEIKKGRPNLPVIAQTAYGMAGDKEKVLNIGFDDYITKPIDAKLLMDKIKRLKLIDDNKL